MLMKMKLVAASALLALAAAGAANAQTRFTDAEIVGMIGKCLTEHAPKNWQTVIFTLDEVPAAEGKKASNATTHKAIVGAENNPPQNLKPCRPDYAAKAVNTFRENQDEKASKWTGVTVTFHRDRRYSLEFRYPQ